MYNNGANSSRSISIASKPIPENVYGWGWVNYTLESNRNSMEVVLLDDIYDTTYVDSLKKFTRLNSSHFLKRNWEIIPSIILFFTFLITQAPIFLFIILGVYIWKTFKFLRARKMIEKVHNQVFLDDSITVYIPGKRFLNSISNPGLKVNSYSAYHDLRLSLDELVEFAHGMNREYRITDYNEED